jgi:hypothetical protein
MQRRAGSAQEPVRKIAWFQDGSFHKSTSQTDENQHRGQISACNSALQKPSIKAGCPEKESQSCRQS